MGKQAKREVLEEKCRKNNVAFIPHKRIFKLLPVARPLGERNGLSRLAWPGLAISETGQSRDGIAVATLPQTTPTHPHPHVLYASLPVEHKRQRKAPLSLPLRRVATTASQKAEIGQEAPSLVGLTAAEHPSSPLLGEGGWPLLLHFIF